MKKIIIFSLFSALLFSANFSMAQSYPSTCDSTAQAIISGVGGCSVIDCDTYSNICAKCCVAVAVPAKTTTSAPSPKPTSQIETVTPSVQENLPEPQTSLATTTASEETVVSTQKSEPIVGLIDFVKSIFTGFFRLFGFGK